MSVLLPHPVRPATPTFSRPAHNGALSHSVDSSGTTHANPICKAAVTCCQSMIQLMPTISICRNPLDRRKPPLIRACSYMSPSVLTCCPDCDCRCTHLLWRKRDRPARGPAPACTARPATLQRWRPWWATTWVACVHQHMRAHVAGCTRSANPDSKCDAGSLDCQGSKLCGGCALLGDRLTSHLNLVGILIRLDKVCQ